MREYSNAGNIIPETNNRDYLISMVPIFNSTQLRLATTVNKINRNFHITHINPENVLSAEFLIDSLTFKGNDVVFETNSPTCYTFEVNNTATIRVENQVDGEWVLLEEILHDGGNAFVNYKGLISATGQVRLVFTGDNFYNYRYVAMFDVPINRLDLIPVYKPYVEYPLPEDFYKLDYVDYDRPYALSHEYSQYKLDYRNAKEKYILIRYGARGAYTVNYFAYPAKFPVNEDNLEEFDAMPFEVPNECIPAIIDEAVSVLLSDENAYMSDTAKRDYYTSMNELERGVNYNKGKRKVRDVNGGW